MKIDDMEAWRRLGRAVAGRRTELRLTQSDVAARGGPSLATMQAIEASRQDSYRDRTLADLEAALGWERGSVEAVLFSGAAPAIAADAALADPVGPQSEDAEEMVFRLRVPPGATPRQREAARRAAEASVRAVLEALDEQEQ